MKIRLAWIPLAALALGSCMRAVTRPEISLEPKGLRVEIVSVPASTPRGAPIYLAASFNGWRPGVPAYQLRDEGNGRYVLDVPDTLSGSVEFKFTRGSWESVEIDSAGNDIPNRQLVVPAGRRVIYKATIAGWRNPANSPPRKSTARPSVSVINSSFAIPQLGRTRRVWIYLPPDYTTSTKRYPVLYMHDGQNVFDAATSFAGEWGVDETLDSLIALGAPPAIVVAIDNGTDKRLDEYSPWPNAKYGGGEGDRYVEFMVQTLKPYIDAHYRTLPDKSNTAIAGSSMGGLISLYAALKHPDVFSRAGVFSPSLWFNPEIYSFAREAVARASSARLYIVSGALEAATEEEADVYLKDQLRMVDSLEAGGLKQGTNVLSLIRPDGKHAEWFWRREFPAAYLWLFGGSAGSPDK
ncbi:MAG TPA: alpha/beta hydrolase-fold protein [Gemmatimonadaceae bacterium]|nr:alpha/beta hydrolase-fold protein [Gemmatimonadaceae bacterium]